MKFGNILVGKRLFVGLGKPKALGRGTKDEIRGTAYFEGPVQVGRDTEYDEVSATVMIAEEYNTDTMLRPHLSVEVKGNVNIEGDGKTTYGMEVGGGAQDPLHVKGDIICDAISPTRLSSRFNVADGKPKPFDIPHPSKEGWRLRYACIEGPEVGVYYRGRVRNRHNVIDLPSYWKDLVDVDSISVQLTPIGAHQNVIVKRWDENKIYLQAQGGMPVDCFFHVYAERKDINPLITEYEGKSWEDYPDQNIYASNPKYDDPNFAGPPNTVTM